MNVIYDSANYYVAEYPAQHGYEVVDKHWLRGTFLQGDVADRFVQSLQLFVAEKGASAERLDEFLGNFDMLMVQSVLYH
ncbi:MAG: hypothetical protein A2W68_01500 [Betaproteobacteria bacterium RIFCSPLOWO2_02_64_14]|nr:MAG: hypothetical protein A2W68_01500 [Betaproteobacteria bacterium RIFCSPLOWO2_02_64_14]